MRIPITIQRQSDMLRKVRMAQRRLNAYEAEQQCINVEKHASCGGEGNCGPDPIATPITDPIEEPPKTNP